MIGGATTLFSWTLRMDSKSVVPHIVRAVFAFVILFAISISFFDAFGTSRTGLRFFENMCRLNVVIITVAGVSYFVTAVTEEKDAGSFMLLRLAGMKKLSITLGKSSSRLVSSLMLLVVQLPFTFLAVTLGGVLWQQILASYIALTGWTILVANVALFCSVRCATSGRAAGMAASLLVLYFTIPRVVPITLTAIPAGLLPPSVTSFVASIPTALAGVDITWRLSEILVNTDNLILVGRQFWLSILIGAAFFAVSTLTLDMGSTATAIGGPIENPRLRKWSISRAWRPAIMWKEFQFFTGGQVFVLAKLIGGGVLLAGFLVLQDANGYGDAPWLSGDYATSAMGTFAAMLAAEILIYASGCLFGELRQGTHSVLATLPISSSRMLLEKLGGCVLTLWPSVFWIAVVTFLGYGTLRDRIEDGHVLSYVVMVGFGSHLAVLFSLYTRWAALPLTVLCSMPAFFCLAVPILALTESTSRIAATQGIHNNLLLLSVVNLFWTWLFVLLPLQIAIRDRWLAVSRQ